MSQRKCKEEVWGTHPRVRTQEWGEVAFQELSGEVGNGSYHTGGEWLRIGEKPSLTRGT